MSLGNSFFFENQPTLLKLLFLTYCQYLEHIIGIIATKKSWWFTVLANYKKQYKILLNRKSVFGRDTRSDDLSQIELLDGPLLWDWQPPPAAHIKRFKCSNAVQKRGSWIDHDLCASVTDCVTAVWTARFICCKMRIIELGQWIKKLFKSALNYLLDNGLYRYAMAENCKYWRRYHWFQHSTITNPNF